MPHTYLEGVEFALALVPPLAGVATVALGVWITFRAWLDTARKVRDRVHEFRRRRAVDRMLAPAPWESTPTPSPASTTSTNRYL